MSNSIMLGRADNGFDLFNGTATPGQTTIAVQTTLVAATTELTGGVNVAVPIAGSTAVRLPKDAAVGSPIVVANHAATAVALLVFPPWNTAANAAAGGKINGTAANTALSVPQNKSAVFYPHPDGISFSANLSA